MTMDIQKQVIRTVANCLGVMEREVTEATTKGELGMDSMDEIELVMVLEDEFGIEIDDAEAESLNTVGEMIAMVAKKKGVN
jgi:acyl carrier protein